MNELVALDMPCGPHMVERIKEAWECGDAVFPLDQRAPQEMRRRLIDAAAPTVIATSQGDTPWNGAPVDTGDALVVASSGTTGEPNCIVLTTDSLISSAKATHSFLSASKDDKWLCCLPPSHVGGFGVIARAILSDIPVIAVPGFSEEAFVEAARDGATLVSLVPTALQRVEAHMYRTILVGGSKTDGDLPNNCVTTYGMTETGGGIAYNGKPLHNVELDVRDSIVHVRAPMLLRQYRNGARPFTHDGWLRTGDIGSFRDGVLHIDGREGDLIITGGENVWPVTVEESIRTHPLVKDVCVAGVPDSEWGHSVHAWIVLHLSKHLDLDEVRAHVKQTLPSYCAPQKVHFIDEIPTTSLGKPQRSRLVASVARTSHN